MVVPPTAGRQAGRARSAHQTPAPAAAPLRCRSVKSSACSWAYASCVSSLRRPTTLAARSAGSRGCWKLARQLCRAHSLFPFCTGAERDRGGASAVHPRRGSLPPPLPATTALMAVVLAIGTRGDVQPLLALSIALKDAGLNPVSLVTHVAHQVSIQRPLLPAPQLVPAQSKRAAPANHPAARRAGSRVLQRRRG